MLFRSPLGPRSQLVSDFFDYMNRQCVAWVVMNNYEELPWVIPSDIDLSIPPELFHCLDNFVSAFAMSKGARIVQKLWHGNMKCAYILAAGPEGAREFCQLDFFTAFSTKWCPALISHEELVLGRSALRNFHVPRPEVELIFTAMRRVFKNDWSMRHCARIAELHQRVFATDWLPEHYSWMWPTLEAAIRGEAEAVSGRRGQDWKRLRASARGNLTLAGKIANAALQIRRIAVRLRDETGQLIALAAPLESVTAQGLEALELVFHRRLLLEGKTAITLPVRLALLKRRKGLILVLAGTDYPEGQVLARRLNRMGLVDQVIYRAGDVGIPGLDVTETAFSSDAELIDAIITIQTAKSAKAIARGGTQTSGAKASL